MLAVSGDRRATELWVERRGLGQRETEVSGRNALQVDSRGGNPKGRQASAVL